MKTLMRIDKGYSILQRVKDRYEAEKSVPELEEIRKRQRDLEEEECGIRLSIDTLRDQLKEQEMQLADVDRQIMSKVGEIYQCGDHAKRAILRKQEEDLKDLKNEMKTSMVEKFTMIDIKLEALNNLKNRKKVLQLEEKPYIKIIGAKEQKIMEDIKKIEKKIRMLRKGIDNNSLKDYDKKRVSMGKVFHPVKEGACSFCGMEIEQKEFDEKFVIECSNCGRMLYVQVEEE